MKRFFRLVRSWFDAGVKHLENKEYVLRDIINQGRKALHKLVEAIATAKVCQKKLEKAIDLVSGKDEKVFVKLQEKLDKQKKYIKKLKTKAEEWKSKIDTAKAKIAELDARFKAIKAMEKLTKTKYNFNDDIWSQLDEFEEEVEEKEMKLDLMLEMDEE